MWPVRRSNWHRIWWSPLLARWIANQSALMHGFNQFLYCTCKTLVIFAVISLMSSGHEESKIIYFLPCFLTIHSCCSGEVVYQIPNPQRFAVLLGWFAASRWVSYSWKAVGAGEGSSAGRVSLVGRRRNGVVRRWFRAKFWWYATIFLRTSVSDTNGLPNLMSENGDFPFGVPIGGEIKGLVIGRPWIQQTSCDRLCLAWLRWSCLTNRDMPQDLGRFVWVWYCLMIRASHKETSRNRRETARRGASSIGEDGREEETPKMYLQQA